MNFSRSGSGVGYKLWRLIRDHAPQDWTSGEMVVALMIADDANDKTLRSYISVTDLAWRSRMTESGVRKNLEKLAGKGFDFRVSHGRDKHGKEIYSAAGKGVQYQVPDIFRRLARASSVSYGLVDKLTEAGTVLPADDGLSTDSGGTVVPLSWDCGPS